MNTNKNIKTHGFSDAEIFAYFDPIYCANNKNIEKTALALGFTFEEVEELEERFYGDLQTLSVFDLPPSS